MRGMNKEVEICETCKQPLPHDAMTTNPRGGAALQCEFCSERATFIIHKRAVCFKHRGQPR
jgi:hypothetical protein